MTDESLRSNLETRLMSHGIYVQHLETESDRIAITYESASVDAGTLQHREVGRVINAVRDLRSEDWHERSIDGIVLDFDGTERATWRAKRQWLVDLREGELSEVDFSEKVIDSIEPVVADEGHNE